MFVFKTTNRERYAKALRHMYIHAEKYHVILHGRDYNAQMKNKAAGCGWYIHYLKHY